MFLEVYPFLLGFPVCLAYNCLKYSLRIFFWSLILVVISSLSLLILFIWKLYFSWWAWLKAYQFCLSFQTNKTNKQANKPALGFVDLFYFFSILFTSLLIIIAFFLLLTLSLFLLLFLIPLDGWLGCLSFSCFLR